MVILIAIAFKQTRPTFILAPAAACCVAGMLRREGRRHELHDLLCLVLQKALMEDNRMKKSMSSDSDECKFNIHAIWD